MRSYTRNVILLVVALLSVVTLSAMAAPEHARLFSQRPKYDHNRLVRVKAMDERTLQNLLSIIGKEPDVWNTDGRIGVNLDMDMMLTPSVYARVLQYASKDTSGALHMETLHDNVQHLVEQEMVSILSQKKWTPGSPTEDYFATYRDYNETISFVKDIAAKYPHLATLQSIGYSWLRRELLIVRLSTDPSADRPAVWLNSMQHAREWIGVPVTTWALKQLLEGYGKDDTITKHLDKIDIYIMPMVNPDGYEATWVHDRLWRKNMRDNGRGIYGVDLNRNWPAGYGIGASSDPSSIVYKGPNPLSEPETSLLAEFLMERKDKIKAGIDFHSYSELILRAYGYKNDKHPEDAENEALGAIMSKAIADTHGAKYQNIRGVDLYPAGGGMDDAMTEYFGFKGFTFELRDTGRYGFVLPASYIKPSIEENFQAILQLNKFVIEKHQL